jgi:MoxR-like ATPase
MLNWYTGTGQRPPYEVEILRSDSFAGGSVRGMIDPNTYVLTGEQKTKVTAAANTALLLGVPLLVAGEPGSGKTQLGYAIAHELGRPKPLLFTTGSTSVAADLFYRYDAIQHFRAAQIKSDSHDSDARAFITYSALGLAIIMAMEQSERQQFLSSNAFLVLQHAPKTQSVVIIDEIDKAPRDFPNDLLTQLSTMRFEVPELGGLRTPELDPDYHPIIVLTTNSERQLPDAFLRRCAYVHVDPPSGDALAEILKNKFRSSLTESHVLLKDVVKFHDVLRNQGLLEKPPSTAEILQFFESLLARKADIGIGLSSQREVAEASISVLAKHKVDFEKIREALHEWN